MKPQFLDKVGAIGAVLTAAGCPACFPLLAVAGSALGLGALRPYEGIVFYVFQGLVILSLIGNVLSYLNHKKAIPLMIGALSPAVIFFAFYIKFNEALLYSGLAGLLIAAVLNYVENRKCRSCCSS